MVPNHLKNQNGKEFWPTQWNPMKIKFWTTRWNLIGNGISDHSTESNEDKVMDHLT